MKSSFIIFTIIIIIIIIIIVISLISLSLVTCYQLKSRFDTAICLIPAVSNTL